MVMQNSPLPTKSTGKRAFRLTVIALLFAALMITAVPAKRAEAGGNADVVAALTAGFLSIDQLFRQTFWGYCPLMPQCTPNMPEFWQYIAGQGLVRAFSGALTQAVDTNTTAQIATTDAIRETIARSQDPLRNQIAAQALNQNTAEVIANASAGSDTSCIEISGATLLAGSFIGTDKLEGYFNSVTSSCLQNLEGCAGSAEFTFTRATSVLTDAIDRSQKGTFKNTVPPDAFVGEGEPEEIRYQPSGPSASDRDYNDGAGILRSLEVAPESLIHEAGYTADSWGESEVGGDIDAAFASGLQFAAFTSADLSIDDRYQGQGLPPSLQAGIVPASATLGDGTTDPLVTDEDLDDLSNPFEFLDLDGLLNTNEPLQSGSSSSTTETTTGETETTTGGSGDPASSSTDGESEREAERAAAVANAVADLSDVGNRPLNECTFDIHCLYMRPTYRSPEHGLLAFETSFSTLVKGIENPPRGALLNTQEGRTEFMQWFARNGIRAMPLFVMSRHHAKRMPVDTGDGKGWCLAMINQIFGKSEEAAARNYLSLHLGDTEQGDTAVSANAVNKCLFYFKHVNPTIREEIAKENSIAEVTRIQTLLTRDLIAMTWKVYEELQLSNILEAHNMALLLQIDKGIQSGTFDTVVQ